jgi:hypothetical protein
MSDPPTRDSAPKAEWIREDLERFRRHARALLRRGRRPCDVARIAFGATNSIARGRVLAEVASAALLWRKTVATWTTDQREAWGRRANALEAEGIGWREAEEAAYREIASEPGRINT